ncbi:hypothetical protein K474DRAFT_1581083, partial [Panus rudis PR-1116 ss-1]
LIKLPVLCNGRAVEAIIDTGSTVNIIHSDLFGKFNNLPLEPTTIQVNTADGNQSHLHGLVRKVPVACGSINTIANLYVSDVSPFDLLLGRPWQRGNKIAIDERDDGTYL